jgi:BlaI family penicillinase repressor
MPARPKVHRLGDLQLKIMQVLWEKTEATIAEVHEGLPAETDLAYTTIATMLRKMESRGLVNHRLEERRFLYRAAVHAEEVTRRMSTHLIERLFEGSLTDMVSHLLTTHEVSRDELSKLEKLIAERKKKL